MHIILKITAISLFLLANLLELSAQRSEDHFVRRRVVNRIDLEEKINRPLVRPGSAYEDNQRFSYSKGMVNAILSGLKKGDYSALHPDDLSESLRWAEVETRINEIDNVYDPVESDWSESEASLEPDEWEEDGWEGDSQSDFDLEYDDLSALEDPQYSMTNSYKAEDDYGNFEMVVQFVEDWIIDKNRGGLRFEIKFFEVIWVDPAGALPDKVLAVFRYEDIENVLDRTKWINRFNQAECRSVKEVLDLRIFNSFLVDVSGTGMSTLEEAEKWRKKMLEFEHHLYTY